MVFTLDALVQIIIIAIVVLVLFWLAGVLLVGIPSLILNLVKLAIVIAALAAAFRLLSKPGTPV